MEKLNEHTAVLGKVEDFAAKLAEQRRTGPAMFCQGRKTFSRTGNPSPNEETDLCLKAAYSQLQVRCTPCNAPVDKLLLSLRCIQCSANSLWDDVTGPWIWAISHCLSLDCVLFLSIISTVKTTH